MTQPSPPKKLVFAIDPLSPEPRLQLAALKVAQKIAANAKCKLEPVFVLGIATLSGLANEKYNPVLQLTDLAKSTVKKWAAGSKVILPLTVLTQTTPSVRARVKTLVEYATEQGNIPVVCATHAKKGIGRLLLGSFAESLTLQTKIPVITINPQSTKLTSVKSVLFATDFSPASKSALFEVARFCELLKAKLFVYHKLEQVDKATAMKYFDSSDFLVLLKKDKEQREYLLEKWNKEIKEESNIKFSSLVEVSKGRTSNCIITQAKKKKVNLIALASLSNPWISPVMGTVTREVIRQASQPVFVIHPKLKSAEEAARSELEEPGHYPGERGLIV